MASGLPVMDALYDELPNFGEVLDDIKKQLALCTSSNDALELMPMLLLAKNQTGYKNLLKLASAAQLDGYYYRPRIDRDLLAKYSEGLIATSGCLAAQIPTAIMEGRDDEARELIGWYQDVFGKENFYLELQQHDIPELETLNKWLLEYGKSNHTHVPLVATNDVHYVLDTDYDPHDTLLCIQTSALKTDTDRLRMSDARK